jgi:hypothetical protein
VDAAQNTITISTREGDRTFAVSPAASIHADGTSCPLSAAAFAGRRGMADYEGGSGPNLSPHASPRSAASCS